MMQQLSKNNHWNQLVIGIVTTAQSPMNYLREHVVKTRGGGTQGALPWSVGPIFVPLKQTWKQEQNV
jgi:hypothetical protein